MTQGQELPRLAEDSPALIRMRYGPTRISTTQGDRNSPMGKPAQEAQMDKERIVAVGHLEEEKPRLNKSLLATIPLIIIIIGN